MRKLICLAYICVLGLTACSEEPPKQTDEVTEPGKIAKIYTQFAVQMAGIELTPDELKIAAQCVQDKIVSPGVKLYRERRLQTLFLEHLFPNELSTYEGLTDESSVRTSAVKRLKKLGFESFEAAAESNNMVARSLLAEYSYYAKFRAVHDTAQGIKPENLVLQYCVLGS